MAFYIGVGAVTKETFRQYNDPDNILGDSNGKYWITTFAKTTGNFNAGVYLDPIRYGNLKLGLNTNPLSYSLGIGLIIYDFVN